MSDKDYGFDLDDILREFGSDSDKPKAKPVSYTHLTLPTIA